MLKKPRGRVLSGVRVTRRGKRLQDFVLSLFFCPETFTRNPTQGFPKAHPRDTQTIRISTFCFKSRPRDPMFLDFLDDFCCFLLFLSICGPFFAEKNRKKTNNYFRAAPVFFDLATLRIVCILHCESHFLYFYFYPISH